MENSICAHFFAIFAHIGLAGCASRRTSYEFHRSSRSLSRLRVRVGPCSAGDAPAKFVGRTMCSSVLHATCTLPNLMRQGKKTCPRKHCNRMYFLRVIYLYYNVLHTGKLCPQERDDAVCALCTNRLTAASYIITYKILCRSKTKPRQATIYLVTSLGNNKSHICSAQYWKNIYCRIYVWYCFTYVD
jgi:hypothetical protein